MRLIDADALMMPINASWRDAGLHSEDYGKIKRWIKNAPTIEADPVKHGRWREYNYPGQECVYCSACKTEYYPDDLIVIGVNDYPYYCPNCGARMDLEGEVHE